MIRRRTLLAGTALAALAAARAQPRSTSPTAAPHEPFGPVRPPQNPPRVALATHLGERTELTRLLAGKVSALQLMFTGCSATCPIQGASFAQAQQRLGSSLSGVQWLSLSVDPLSDDPAALARWLQRFGAQPGWTALQPQPTGLDALLDFLQGRAKGIDRHIGQVFLFDRRGQLVFRTADLPSPGEVSALMKRLAEVA